MSEHLSLSRLGQLLWTDVMVRIRPVAMISAIFAGLMLVNGLIVAEDSGPQTNVFVFWIMLILFGWGPIAASLSFRELHDRTKNTGYLLLPASALEKTLSRLLLVILIFPVFAVLFANAVSWINAGINLVLFGRNGLLFPFFGPEASIGFGLFIVNQSLYFLGGAWFRRMHFIKTALVLTFGPIVLFIVTGLILQLVFPDLTSGAVDPDPDFELEAFYSMYRNLIGTLGTIGRMLFFVAIPLFCWVVAWLRVKETQVSYGV